MTDMMTLMKADPNLKVVLKEFPVLGPGSQDAAKVGVAVRMQDKTGKKYLEYHQKLMTGRGQIDKARALAAAKEVGLDVARIERDLGGEEVRASIEESFKLAEKLGVNGTPSLCDRQRRRGRAPSASRRCAKRSTTPDAARRPANRRWSLYIRLLIAAAIPRAQTMLRQKAIRVEETPCQPSIKALQRRSVLPRRAGAGRRRSRRRKAGRSVRSS